MQETVVFTEEMSSSFAAAILPMIKGYIDENREEYEAFLVEWNAKKQAGRDRF